MAWFRQSLVKFYLWLKALIDAGRVSIGYVRHASPIASPYHWIINIPKHPSPPSVSWNRLVWLALTIIFRGSAAGNMTLSASFLFQATCPAHYLYAALFIVPLYRARSPRHARRGWRLAWVCGVTPNACFGVAAVSSISVTCLLVEAMRVRAGVVICARHAAGRRTSGGILSVLWFSYRFGGSASSFLLYGTRDGIGRYVALHSILFN